MKLSGLALLGALSLPISACSYHITPPCANGACDDAAQPLDQAGLSPGLPGPRRVASFDLTVPLPGAVRIQTTVVGPGMDATTLGAGPFPLVIASPAQGLQRALLYPYAARLASYGVLTVIQSPRSERDYQGYVNDTSGVLDWLLAPTGAAEVTAAIAGRAAADRIGLLGYGLGGKISVMLAARDARVRALFLLDPLDPPSPVAGTLGARDLIGGLHLPSPLGLLAESLSQQAGPQQTPCAPLDQGYAVLMPLAPTGSVGLLLQGAGHADFIEDRIRCGLFCAACPAGTAATAQTAALAVRYVTAYFLVTLAQSVAGIGLQARDFLGRAQFDEDKQAGLVTMVQ